MIFRRKTKREREQVRAEASVMRHERERARAEGAALDTDVAADVEKFSRLLREAVARTQLPDPAPEFPACPHHPQWQPQRPFEGAPRPPRSTCPRCLAEATPKPSGSGGGGPEVWVDGGPRRQLPPKFEAIWQKRLEERQANGEILPGSSEERDLIDYMDAHREETVPSRRVVYANRFTGVTLYGKPRRTRRYRIRF
jgi:hypothetical protein